MIPHDVMVPMWWALVVVLAVVTVKISDHFQGPTPRI